MIDTHCHLTFPDFAGRVGDVLEAARARGVLGAITVATTTANVAECRALAERHENVWFSAGVHPLHCDEPADWEAMLEGSRHPRCVAFGELGLDHHYPKPPRDLQVRILRKQLSVIADSGIEKPIIVHCREAYADLIAILREMGFPGERFVFHCFTGGPDDVRRVLDFGSWVSFTGIVTFRNAGEIQGAARLVPDDRIMIETDAPFLTPEPHRKVRPNEPKFAIDTARFVADLRGMRFEAFEALLDRNTERFFGIRAV